MAGDSSGAQLLLKLRLLVVRLFVADSWLLGDVAGSGCLGNPLVYFPKPEQKKMKMLLVFERSSEFGKEIPSAVTPPHLLR